MRAQFMVLTAHKINFLSYKFCALKDTLLSWKGFLNYTGDRMAMNMASRKMAGKKTPAGEGSTAMTGGPMAKKSKIGKAMAAKKMATKKPAKGY